MSSLGGRSNQGEGRGPARGCRLCPRLAAFRDANRAAHPAFHNAPVPAFGALDARLLVVGLAPGLKGANRTGRPFTGDFAGALLYETLAAFGFAHGTFRASPDDGLALADCRITNAVRCVPPQNKPVAAEIAQCRAFLAGEIAAMPNLRAVLALGRIAHDATLRALGRKPSAHAFAHGATHLVAGEDGRYLALCDSYHCSRYNTQTRRLTPAMFRDVIAALRRRLDESV